MSEKVERALEIVRSFTEAEFHSFMEMLFVSETSQSNISFNDLIGKNRFKNGIVCPWMQMNKELSEESLERNILNSSTSHNFRLYTSEISKKPVLPLAA